MLSKFLAIAAVVTAASCAVPESATTIRVGAATRHYELYVPSDTPDLPLVIALHGHGGSGITMEKFTGLDDIAAREHFVVAYPDGVDHQWADGRRANAGADDVAFIAALIDEIAAQHHIDRERVYVTGASNGGMMAYTLACVMADRIAAIAPVIGELDANVAPTCHPARPIPVLAINGVDDPIVPYAGGEIRGRVLSALDSTKVFADRAGCGAPTEVAEPDRVDDGTRVRRYTYACTAPAEVELVAIDGGGHTWPGGTQYLPKFMIGRVSREFSASERIWAFFSRH